MYLQVPLQALFRTEMLQLWAVLRQNLNDDFRLRNQLDEVLGKIQTIEAKTSPMTVAETKQVDGKNVEPVFAASTAGRASQTTSATTYMSTEDVQKAKVCYFT